jgi:hypothetical protein
MAKNKLSLWDQIDDHDAERACSLLQNPNDKKLSQALNGYDRATDKKKRRRRTALLCALTLIEGEIGISSIIRAVNRLCDTDGIAEVNEDSMRDLVAYMKTDEKGKKIMRQIVNCLSNTANDMDSEKLARKFEMRMNFIEHKPKTDIPFEIHWY